jgi:hypothetical protein
MAKAKTPEPPLGRIKLIEAIAAPLGFFVLALLIVEAFLATVLTVAPIDPPDRMHGVWVGVGLFILVTLIGSMLALEPCRRSLS